MGELTDKAKGLANEAIGNIKQAVASDDNAKLKAVITPSLLKHQYPNVCHHIQRRSDL